MKTVEQKSSAAAARPSGPFFRKGKSDDVAGTRDNDASFFKRMSAGKSIQAKLTVSQPGDPYEKEADHVANRVVQRMNGKEPDHKMPEAEPVTPVQRSSCPECQQKEETRQPEEDRKTVHQQQAGTPGNDKLRREAAAPADDDRIVHRKEERHEKEEEVRRKEENPHSSIIDDRGTIEERLNNLKGKGEPMAPATQRNMERAMGADFSGVRIHNDPDAHQLSKELNAHAFTYGTDIYFNSNKYDDKSTGGNQLLAHELTHTLQQDEKIGRKPAQAMRSSLSAGTTAFRSTAPASLIHRNTVMRAPDDTPPEPTAAELIDKYTTLLILDEEGLGKELAGKLPANTKIVNDVLDQVPGFRKDDVAYHTSRALGSRMTNVDDGLRMRFVREMVHGVVTDSEELAISDIWKSFDDAKRQTVAEGNRELWKKSLDESDYLEASVKPEIDAFAQDVVGLAWAYLDENKQVVESEASHYGINLDKPEEQLNARNEYYTALKQMVPGVIKLRKQMDELRQIPVGYYQKSDCLIGDCRGISYFNPDYQPMMPPDKSESPPWASWQDVKTQYDRASALISAFSSLYPTVYILIQQDKIDELSKSMDGSDGLKVIAQSLVKTREKIGESHEKIGTSIPYTDLKMSQMQLLTGATAVPYAPRYPWTKPYYGDIANYDLKDKADREFWVQLGLTMLAAIALIAAPLTGGASAALLIGFGLGIGLGQAAMSWDKYMNMSALGDASAKEELSLITQGEIKAQLVEAIVNTIALFIDAYGAKAATAGAKASREAFEAAEKGVKQQLMEAAQKKALLQAGKDVGLTLGMAGGSALLHELENDEPDYNLTGAASRNIMELGPDDASGTGAPVSKMSIQRVGGDPPPVGKAPKEPIILTGGEFEQAVEKALRQGAVPGLPRMDFVIPGQYNGSGWGIDRIGIVWDPVSGNVDVYHLEMKFVSEGSPHIPGLGPTASGTQSGERWTANAIEGLLTSQHPSARASKERLRRALSKLYPEEKIDMALMREFLEKKLSNAKVVIVAPEWANFSRLYKQVAALVRHGREISILKVFKE